MTVVMCPNLVPASVVTNCGVAALLAVLEFKGVPKPHLMFGDDNGCFYMRSGHVGYIAASYRYTVAQQLSRYGITLYEYHSDSPDEVWDAITTNLRRLNPVLFYCNTAYLPYFPTYNTPHLTVVKGYDPVSRRIYLCDTVGRSEDSIPWDVFLQAVALPPFMAKWLGARKRYKWEVIDVEGVRPPTRETLRSQVRYNLDLLRAETSLSEADRARLLALWEMPPESRVISGWAALEAYAEDVPDLFGNTESAFIYRTHLMVWDFWQQRRILCEILRHLAREEGNPAFDTAANRLDEAIKSWTIIRGLVMKHEMRPTPQNLLALARRLRQVKEEEMRALGDLVL